MLEDEEMLPSGISLDHKFGPLLPSFPRASTRLKSLDVPRESQAWRGILAACMVHHIKTHSSLQIRLHRLGNLLPRNTDVRRENETMPTAQNLRKLKDKRAES